MRLGTFIPTMQPTYASVEELLDNHGTTFADIKYDGYRVQIHKGARTKIYTRNGNELNYYCYPEIMEAVSKLPKCVLEAELIGEGSNHKQVFDNVKARFRRPGLKEDSVKSYLESGIIDSTPLGLRVFDTLYYEGKWLDQEPLDVRRIYTARFDLKNIKPSETQKVSNKDELEALIQKTLDNKREGRVCKNPNSIYKSGKKGIDWVKFKRYEPLDLVVVGTYNDFDFQPFNAVLVATYNEGKFETIGKVAVTREDFAEQIDRELSFMDCPPNNVLIGENLPDRYVAPTAVIEVRALNINFNKNKYTCGKEYGKSYGMRIGFMQQLRQDKNADQATSTEDVKKIYEVFK